MDIKKIKSNRIIPSSAFSVPKSKIKQYDVSNKKKPEIGDLVFGEVTKLGHHKEIQNQSARLHTLNVGTRSVFVFGNRYAPDQFEGLVPSSFTEHVDLFSQGGIVGEVQTQNHLISVPTTVKVLGYICDSQGEVVNTRDYVLIQPKHTVRKKRGAKVILCIGTSMNSGKTHAAAACCYALSSAGKNVRAAKITGTASLKDILLMNDSGAEHIADFTYFGYPSSYLMEADKLLWMFNSFDMKYGNDPKNYLVIEFADGIFQRETAMLLKMPEVRDRIHKLIFCALGSSSVFGGIHVLKDDFGLEPDAISGLCSSSPLAMREIKSFSNLPILQSMEKDYKAIFRIIK